ncbi:MAG TPA: DUF3135 domain-containing protein [Burkholderiales bacterium]|jgi:hypothetical protein
MSATTPAPGSLPSDPENFDFDAWRRLAEQDPKAFFAQREQAIEACIAGNPSAAGREQMREMQSQIDGMRLISANPDRALQGIATLLSDHLQALAANLAGLGEETRRLSGLTQRLRSRLA